MVIYMLESSNECWFKMTLGSLWLVSQKKPKRDPLGSGLESLGLSWLVAAGWKHVSCVGNCLNHICNHVISCINVIMYICDYVYIYIILFYSWIYEFISWTSFLAVIYHMNYVCMSIICICICICVYIYTYICMWIYIYVYIYIRVYVYIYTYIYIYRYTPTYYIFTYTVYHSLNQMLQPQKEAQRIQCAWRLLGHKGFGISPLPPARRAAMYRFNACRTAHRKEELQGPQRMYVYTNVITYG